MKLRKINLIGLVLLLFFCATQINEIFAKTTTQYQLYRLSDDPSNDRRPKLAINDQGIVWVVWESDRDGDFDIYGEKFENASWSDLIEVAQDTNSTTLCDIIFYTANDLFIFGIETNLKNLRYGTSNVRGSFFYHEFAGDSLSERKFMALVDHHLPNDIINYPQYYPDNLPKVILLNNSLIACYHRGTENYYAHDWSDSLLLRYYKYTWSEEKCDSIFVSSAKQGYDFVFHLPINKISLNAVGVFMVDYYEHWPNYPYSLYNSQTSLIFNEFYDTSYILYNSKGGSGTRYKYGISVYDYGSSKNSIFSAGYLIDKNKSVVRRTKSAIDSFAIVAKEWQLPITSNLRISQMSDLVAFVWSDSANIYVKTFQDSTWYETLELPLNGLTHIENSLNCAVYNNQQIWITFDAIDNENKDVYALSVPASFVVDTVMTSVKQKSVNITSPNDFILFQNYPNPLNSNTEIRYSIPHGRSTYHVTLKIYDIRSRLVNTLVNQNQAGGIYSMRWAGKDYIGNHVPSGIYFYSLEADSYKASRKILLIN